MKILITGGSGFVGGALWRAARAQGHEVLSLGRRPLPDPDYRVCDLTLPLELDFRPDVVVHAAARSSPWGSAREFAAQNITATRHVVDFCRRNGAPYLLHISTSAVMYANEHQFDLDEASPLPVQPINRYAQTKREAEEVVRAYDGPWSIARVRAVFGPNDTVVFPRILRAAQSGRLPYLLASRPVIGDLIYIDTLVEYLLRMTAKRATGLYLLTNNQPVPIWEFLNSVLTQLGLPAPTRRVPVNRALLAARLIETTYAMLPFLGEPPITQFGVSVFAYSKTFRVAKALRDLGPPAVSLDEGLARFVEWQKRQLA